MTTININSGDGKCHVLSPDGTYGCTKRSHHESPDCRNTAAGISWCGDCAKWTCEHIAVGNLDKATGEPA